MKSKTLDSGFRRNDEQNKVLRASLSRRGGRGRSKA